MVEPPAEPPPAAKDEDSSSDGEVTFTIDGIDGDVAAVVEPPGATPEAGASPQAGSSPVGEGSKPCPEAGIVVRGSPDSGVAHHARQLFEYFLHVSHDSESDGGLDWRRWHSAQHCIAAVLMETFRMGQYSTREATTGAVNADANCVTLAFDSVTKHLTRCDFAPCGFNIAHFPSGSRQVCC